MRTTVSVMFVAVAMATALTTLEFPTDGDDGGIAPLGGAMSAHVDDLRGDVGGFASEGRGAMSAYSKRHSTGLSAVGLASLTFAAARGQEREGLIAQLAAVQAEAVRLRDELRSVRDDLDLCRFGPDTPWGAFLRSDDAAHVAGPDDRAALRRLLDEFPVFLRAGEAQSLATQAREAWATREDAWAAKVAALGEVRLLAELPPREAAELKRRLARPVARAGR